MKKLFLPVKEEEINQLKVGDKVLISGKILCGRDAVLPKLVAMSQEELKKSNIELEGGLIFHTAVSVAGIGPTSSNKYEIESSIPNLSEKGVKIHLGKGELGKETIKELEKNNSIYAVIPPVTALLKTKTISQRVLAFEEEGMEALYEVEVDSIPAIVAVAHGKSVYDKE